MPAVMTLCLLVNFCPLRSVLPASILFTFCSSLYNVAEEVNLDHRCQVCIVLFT